MSIAHATARSTGVRPPGLDDAADDERAGLLGGAGAATEVVGRIAGVAVETHEQIAGRGADARVEPVRHPRGLVRQCPELDPVAVGGGPEPLDGAVRGAAVGDDQLHVAVEVLRGDVRDETVDVLGLVQHGSDHRDLPDAPATGGHRVRPPAADAARPAKSASVTASTCVSVMCAKSGSVRIRSAIASV